MALDTYANLLITIADWLNKTSLTAQIPDFVTLAEARLRRELKDWLRSTLLVTNVTADYALPGTVQDVVGVAYNDGAAGAHNFPVDLISRTDYQTWMERDAGANTPAGQLAFPDLAVPAHLAGQRGQLADHQAIALDQAERPGRGARPQHPVVTVHDHGGR